MEEASSFKLSFRIANSISSFCSQFCPGLVIGPLKPFLLIFFQAEKNLCGKVKVSESLDGHCKGPDID